MAGSETGTGGAAGTREALELAVRDLQRVAASLSRIADAEALRDLAAGRRREIAGADVRALVRARRLRARFLPPSLPDPAWAILLELFAVRLEGRRATVTGAADAAGLPQTTALRWTGWLIDRGLVLRRADPEDERAVLLSLSEGAADAVRAYLAEALRLSPWLV